MLEVLKDALPDNLGEICAAVVTIVTAIIGLFRKRKTTLTNNGN